MTTKVGSSSIHQLKSVQTVNPDQLVKLVGVLEYISTQQSSWVFTLEDCTGRVDLVRDIIVDRRIESQEERVERESDECLVTGSNAPPPVYKYGEYHRVLGSYNPDRKVVEVTCIQPVSDKNEITTHNLEIIFQFITSSKANK